MNGDRPPAGARLPYACRLYGVHLRSAWPLVCPNAASSELLSIDLVEGDPARFSEPSRQATLPPDPEAWFHHVRLPDGADYLRWSDLFEFLVSADGRTIAGQPRAPRQGEGLGVSPKKSPIRSRARRSQTRPSHVDRARMAEYLEAFQTYLLGQVLSFALLKHGIEPLHATVVVVDGEAVAFIGDCGYGKSTLGAAFIQAGHAVLTDDLLVLGEAAGRFLAYPGWPRIKLFPEIARSLLGEQVRGAPMNHRTPKLIVPLSAPAAHPHEVPLRACYALSPPDTAATDQVTIVELSARSACLELIAGTYNPRVTDSARLRQQLAFASQVARSVPVKRLTYPRDLARIEATRDAILADVRRSRPARPHCP